MQEWRRFGIGCSVLNALVTTTNRLRFDGHSTAYQRSLRSKLRNPLAAVTLKYLFKAARKSHSYGRNVGRRMVVARPNCSRILVVTTAV